MTKEYFIEYVDNWDDLIEFDRDYETESLLDVYDRDALDDYVNNLLNYLARNNYWEEIRDMLLEIPDTRYYRYEGYMEFSDIDNEYDFQVYKQMVLEKAEDVEVFDCDEEENEEENEEEDEEYIVEIFKTKEHDDDFDYVVGQEDISLNDMFGCVVEKVDEVLVV